MLLDAMLPEMSGAEVLREIILSCGGRRPLVILLSSAGIDFGSRDSRLRDADLSLTKPIKQADLLTAIPGWLPRKRWKNRTPPRRRTHGLPRWPPCTSSSPRMDG